MAGIFCSSVWSQLVLPRWLCWFWQCLLTWAGLAGYPLISAALLWGSWPDPICPFSLSSSIRLLQHILMAMTMTPNGHTQLSSTLLDLACITSTKIPLTKANHMVKPRGQEIHSAKICPALISERIAQPLQGILMWDFYLKANDTVQWDKENAGKLRESVIPCTFHGPGEGPLFCKPPVMPMPLVQGALSCRLIDGLLEWECQFQRYLRHVMRTHIRAVWENCKNR